MEEQELIKNLQIIFDNFKNVDYWTDKQIQTILEDKDIDIAQDQKIIQKVIKLLLSAKPEDVSIYYYMLATIIDACYSTQIRSKSSNSENNLRHVVDEISKNFNNPNEIKELETEVLKEKINNICIKLLECKITSKSEKFPFSFITKFFSLFRLYTVGQDGQLPIYDTYVNEYLNKKSKKFVVGNYYHKKKDVRIYYDFVEKMANLKGELTFYQQDQRIWLTMYEVKQQIKDYNQKINKEKLVKDVLNGENKSPEAKFFDWLIKRFI